MKHLYNAFKYFVENNKDNELHNYIKPDEDNHSVKFIIQNGTIKDCGVNGVQITDVLKYVMYVYKSLNNNIQCRENELTIDDIENALEWQNKRTENRK